VAKAVAAIKEVVIVVVATKAVLDHAQPMHPAQPEILPVPAGETALRKSKS